MSVKKLWSSLVEGDEDCIGPIGKLLCLWQTQNKICCTCMATFQTCWADPVVHHLLLKSSMVLYLIRDWLQRSSSNVKDVKDTFELLHCSYTLNFHHYLDWNSPDTFCKIFAFYVFQSSQWCNFAHIAGTYMIYKNSYKCMENNEFLLGPLSHNFQ